jgi:YVTN family beta-propeller protein
MIGYENPDLRILNGATNELQKTAIGEHMWAMAINEATSKVYVTRTGSAEIWEFDEASGQTSRIPVGAIPCAIAIDQKTNILYVLNYDDSTVTVISGASRHTVATVKAGLHPQAITVDSNSNRVYVANTHASTVTVINGQDNTVVATIPVGKNPYALAANPKTGKVYTANFGEPSFTALP